MRRQTNICSTAGLKFRLPGRWSPRCSHSKYLLPAFPQSRGTLLRLTFRRADKRGVADNPRSQNVPKTKVEPAKLVEITEDHRKLLVIENFDYPLATIHKNINFDTKFPSWTSPVRPRSPAPNLLHNFNHI
jgi:hypothetical protein